MTEQEIAAIKAGCKIEMEVERVGNIAYGGVKLLLLGGEAETFFSLEELAHATLTPAPEPALAVGDVVEYLDERWEVVAAPRMSKVGREEVGLWRDERGFQGVFASHCTRVPQ